ncbi:hypothetical protein D3C80_878440 [compost metagenome]
MRHRCAAWHPLRQEADPPENSGNHRRHEFWRAVGQRQRGAWPWCDHRRHQHHHGRRRHDPGRTRPVAAPGVPVPAVALWHEPRRPAQGRCHRDRPWPGCQAGRWRHAAGHEGDRARGRHAHLADRRRPAQRLPPPGLDRPGRPGDQDRRDPRDHRLGKTHLREDRRQPPVLRRQAGGEGRCGCDRARRHAGRYRRDSGSVHRTRWHPYPAGHSAGSAGAAGNGHAPQGAADRFRWYSQWCRRGQGHGPRG